MTAHRVGLASLSISDEIMQAALGFEVPFTRRDLERRTGRVVTTWLASQVRHGNLHRYKVDGTYSYEWVND